VTEAVKMINSWVGDATHGRITAALPPNSLPQGQTAMVLVNALTFGARWMYPFVPQSTKPGSFHLPSGTTVQVPLMHHSMDYGYAEDESWQLVEIPYETTKLQRGDCSMVCLLPKDKTLDEAIAELTVERLLGLIESLGTSDVVSLTMPRFAFDSSWRFKEVCERLGMRDAFDADRADFSRMYEGGAPSGIWIDDGYQTSKISVDERGTEAASSSIIAEVGGGTQREMVLDRPFLFLVRDIPTGAVLFMGRLMDPRE
jgi:serpin B